MAMRHLRTLCAGIMVAAIGFGAVARAETIDTHVGKLDFELGVCFTNHQSLIVAALGVEVAIAAGNPRLGREVFFGNFLIYLIYMVILGVTGQHVFANLGAKQAGRARRAVAPRRGSGQSQLCRVLRNRRIRDR